MNDDEHINVYSYDPNYGNRLGEQCATSFSKLSFSMTDLQRWFEVIQTLLWMARHCRCSSHCDVHFLNCGENSSLASGKMCKFHNPTGLKSGNWIPNKYSKYIFLTSSKNYTSKWHVHKWPPGDGTPMQTWELDFFKVHFNKSEKYELWAALQSRAELLQTLEAR